MEWTENVLTKWFLHVRLRYGVIRTFKNRYKIILITKLRMMLSSLLIVVLHACCIDIRAVEDPSMKWTENVLTKWFLHVRLRYGVIRTFKNRYKIILITKLRMMLSSLLIVVLYAVLIYVQLEIPQWSEQKTF